MQKITKVLICDDSALMREILASFIRSAEDMELVGAAIDPIDAREKIKQLNPDVLTLDIEMPKMDGLTFLEKIMTLRPMPVIMVSTLTQKGADATLQALETGAFDYVGKPGHAIQNDQMAAFREEVLSKIRAAATSRLAERYRDRVQKAAPAPLNFNAKASEPLKLIAIGSSTGGVEALRDIMRELPADLPPIVITQHMPRAFTESFASRLDKLSGVRVSLAVNEGALLPGHAYVAPGGEHLGIGKRGSQLIAQVRPGEPVSGHCPSVDVQFESVAKQVGGEALGVILTGMGRDGAQGMLAMRNAGAYTIGQDEKSCVVYGMPKAAMQLGGVVEQLPLSRIAKGIVERCEKGVAHGG